MKTQHLQSTRLSLMSSQAGKAALHLLAVVLFGFGTATHAQDFKDNTGLKERAQRGWWFYEDPEKKPKEAPKPAPKAPEEPKDEVAKPEPKKDRKEQCKDPKQWDPKCGFIDPGENFAFQEQQRDALLERMSLARNDPQAVENFQRYMRWATKRSLEVANLWMFNNVQNPDLDPSVTAPINSFGLRLMSEVKKAEADEVYAAIRKDGGALVYFTRSDCEYCNKMAPSVKYLSRKMNIPVWNAALDNKCVGEFSECKTGEAVKPAAQALQVGIVPSLFLYVAPNTWIRLSNGVSTEDQIEGRVVNFFLAYRNALLKGVKNGQDGQPSVDFDMKRKSGTAEGVKTKEGTSPRLPTDKEVEAFIGKSTAKP